MSSQPTNEQIARVKYAPDGSHRATWEEVGEQFGLSADAARSRARRSAFYQDLHSGDTQDPEEAVTVSEEGANAVVVTLSSTAIKTLDELIEAAQIDTDVWQCVRFLPNAWTTSGKIDGEWSQIQNWQAKAWFERIEPEPIYPVVQPVEITATYQEPERLNGDGWHRALVFGDAHFGFRLLMAPMRLVPFHDRAALDVALQLAEAARAERVDIAGDVLDLPDFSDSFVRSPEFARCVDPAKDEAAWWLEQFRQAVGGPVYVYEGNHEQRVDRALAKHVPAAYDVRANARVKAWSVPELLGLEGLGVTWVEGYQDARLFLNDRLAIEHGYIARKRSGSTARAYLDEGRDYSTVFFHIHRRERASMARHRRKKRRVVEAVCPGGLMRVDAEVPGDREVSQWSQGVALVDYHADGRYQIYPVPIADGVAYWQGREIRARDRLEDLRQDLPDWKGVL
jgi:hypothetical protein